MLYIFWGTGCGIALVSLAVLTIRLLVLALGLLVVLLTALVIILDWRCGTAALWALGRWA